MANALYDKGREAFLKAQINWIDDTIKVALVRVPRPGTTPLQDEYKVNLATHEFLSSVPTEAVISTQVLVRDPQTAATNGVADGNDITFENVVGKVGALVIYKQSPTFTRESSRLIAYLDSISGLPYNGTGGNVKIKWDDANNKIFKL